MSQKQFKQALSNLEASLAQRYGGEVNNSYDASDEFFYDGQILEEAGIGAVYVAMPSGRMGWMNISDFSF